MIGLVGDDVLAGLVDGGGGLGLVEEVKHHGDGEESGDGVLRSLTLLVFLLPLTTCCCTISYYEIYLTYILLTKVSYLQR